MGRVARMVRESLEAPLTMLGNRDLRRIQLGNVGSVLGNGAYLVALLVYAYDEGGAALVGLSTIIRVIPAALVGPFTSVLGDRIGRRVTMVGADIVRGAFMLGAAAVIAADGPVWAVFTLIMAVSIAGTAFRPAAQAILPGLARSPDELAAANVTVSLIISVGAVLGPTIGAIVLAASNTPVVFVFNGATFFWSAVLVALVREPKLEGAIRRARNPFGREAAAGVSAIVHSHPMRLLTALYVAQSFVGGAMAVFVVLTAQELTDAGSSGVGIIQASSGIGGLIGGFLTFGLVARRALSWNFGVGLALYGIPLTVVALVSDLGVALPLFAVAGVANTLVDVSASTLLQRGVPNEVLSRAFGALQSLLLAALGVGCIAAPAVVELIGTRATLLVFGASLPVLAAATWTRLRAIDRGVEAAPGTEVLRRVPMLALLPEAALERLAARSEQVRVPAGEVVFSEGDPGDRFYVVEEGEVEIAGKTFGPGEPFGEIALLRDVPRTATVTARDDVVLRAIHRDDFVAAVTAQSEAVEAADALIASRLAPVSG
jgi:predicted MFS family arabinose efflux permease